MPDPVPYWDAWKLAEQGHEKSFDGDEHDAAEQLDWLLRDSVKRQSIADVPLGAFLSGGTDSSLIVAMMQLEAKQPVRTFSIGFMEKSYDETDSDLVLVYEPGFSSLFEWNL